MHSPVFCHIQYSIDRYLLLKKVNIKINYHSVWAMMMETDVMECGVWVMMENLIEVGSILVHRLVVRPMTCPSSTTLLMPSWHSNQMGEKTLQQQLCKHLYM